MTDPGVPAQRRKRDEGKRDQHGEQRNGQPGQSAARTDRRGRRPIGWGGRERGCGWRYGVSGRRCSDALLLIQSILSNNHSFTNVEDINRNFSPYLAAPADPASPIAASRIMSLADVVGMSTRNLARHFVGETGITPHEFVERARIDAARMLLEGSDRPLKSVAYNCGFGTADRMRVVFSERLGVTPAHYRANFRRSEPRGRG
jgi:AraC-like DNA-binding protein